MGCGGLLGRFWLLGRIWAGSAGSKNPALGKELICAESKALGKVILFKINFKKSKMM
jgi:hypothetical protein